VAGGRLPAHPGVTVTVTLDRQDLADTTAAIIETYTRADIDGVCVADGYGASLRVFAGELRVDDGLGTDRRHRSYAPVGSGLRRVVVVGHASITTDALAWCQQRSVNVAVLGRDLDVLVCSAPGRDDARVRRAQATAPNDLSGVRVARILLGAKLAGHEQIARGVLADPETADTIHAFADALDGSDDLDEMRSLEAVAAEVYWAAWAASPATRLRFVPREVSKGRIPEHWQRFDRRASLLGSANSNRNAERPVNALLNYAYSLVEVECRIACAAVGLDSGLGVVHLDRAGRASMALDLAEVARPEAERFVLGLVKARTFRRRDFWQGDDGRVRVLAPSSHDLSAAMGRFAQQVAPFAEAVAHVLAGEVETKIGRPTPLTGTARREAQERVKVRKSLRAAERARSAAPGKTTGAGSVYTCPDCGVPVGSARRVRCDACIGADPSQSPGLRQSRARAISSRRRAEAGWSAHHPAGPLDPTWWEQTLHPALAGLPLPAIIAATGVAKSTASEWRSGKHVPHPMHWETLADLAGVESPELTGRSEGVAS